MNGGTRRPATAIRCLAALLALSIALATRPAAAGLDADAAAWTSDDARTLGRAAPRLVDSTVAGAFDAMDDRVDAYAEWVYGWLSSLLTAWDLAYVGAVEAGRQIAAGQVPVPGILHDSLADVVQRRFEDIVIRPARTNQALIEGWRRAMVRLSAFDARLAEARRRRIEAAAVGAGVDPGPALRRYGTPLLAPSIVDSSPPSELAHTALDEVEAGAGGTSDRILVRSLRPLATRAISVTTRLLIAPVAGGILASPLAATNGLATAVAAMAAVSAGVWGVDYALNRVDVALTRSSFEIDLQRLVQDAHAQASQLARRHAQAVTCIAMTELARAAVAACAEQDTIAATGRSG